MTNKAIINKYQSMTDIEHVLKRPDSYIGSVNLLTINTYILEKNKIIKKTIEKNQGFLKLFDEVVINSIDESKLNKKLNKINVIVTKDYVEILDNGGIPIIKSKKTDNKYIPEFVFGQLRTSSNYDDSQKRELAGTNGFGIKIVNIFSNRFIVESSDGKKKFQQEFKNNLSKRTKVKITPCKKKYTKIKYYPDLERFGMNTIDDTHLNLFKKRIFDLAGLNRNIKFTFNKEKISFKSFKDYCLSYENVEEEHFFMANSKLWDVGLTYSDNGFKQVSFANGIGTSDGGTHVEYIFNQIVNFLKPIFLKKHKITLKPHDIRNNLFLFVNATIVNNRFSSQTKEKLTTDQKKFGTEFLLPKDVLIQISKSEIVQRILDWKKTKLELAEKVELRKLNKQVGKLKVPNLIDCSSKTRRNCDLRIFEGFSAGNGAVKHRDPKTQGLYLLKGKILNTYDLKSSKILQNKELSGLISTLGLEIGNPSIKNLRYGKILIVTDMDVDGSNICSLLINFLAINWIDLFKENRVFRVITPLLIIKDNKKQKDIYTEEEYKQFLKDNPNKKYRIEYKKGLGALSDKDYKKMMESPKLLKITADDLFKESLYNWFGKDSDRRKELLLNKNSKILKTIKKVVKKKTTKLKIVKQKVVKTIINSNLLNSI